MNPPEPFYQAGIILYQRLLMSESTALVELLWCTPSVQSGQTALGEERQKKKS